MNNLPLLLTTFVAIIFIVGIVLIQKSETKKTGYLLIISVAILVLIRYFSFNYTFDVDFFADSAGEDLTLILFFISMAAFALSPFAFLTGLFFAIKGSKYRKLGIIFMISAIIAFIIGINVCGQIHI